MNRSNKVLGVSAYLIFFLFTLVSAEELTITTYYPSPNGSYKHLKWGTRGELTDQDGASIRLGGSGTPFIDFYNDTVSATYDMRIALTGDDILFIDGGGVGIGTTTLSTVDTKLEVAGQIRTVPGPMNLVRGEINAAGGGVAGVIGVNSALGTWGYLGFNGFGTGAGVAGIATGAAASSGYFQGGIGVLIDGDLTLTGTGNAIKPGGGPWAAPSDARLKKNVRSLDGALEKMLSLHGIVFEWKEPEKQGDLTGIQMGLLAQDVETVFPQWVGSDRNGYKNITTRGFEALTVESIRELKAENEALKAKIIEIEAKLNRVQKVR